MPDPARSRHLPRARPSPIASARKGPHGTLWQFYRELLRLRRTLPPSPTLDLESVDVTYNEEAKTLAVRRWAREQRTLALFNFSDREQRWRLPQLGREGAQHPRPARPRCSRGRRWERSSWILPPSAGAGRVARCPIALASDSDTTVTLQPLSVALFTNDKGNRKSYGGTLPLHPRPLLPAAARESLARSDRVAGLRLSVSRLERADHGGVLRAECRRPHPRWRRGGSRRSSRTTRASASTSARPCSPGWRRKRPTSIGRSSTPTATAVDRFAGHGCGDRAGVQPHDPAPRQPARQVDANPLGHSRISRTASAASPEGLWLAETAVDLETLDIMAEQGLKYTILAPSQAGQVRAIGAEEWEDVSGARIDPTRAYVQRLPSGRSIALFFYDGPISRGVAFEGLLDRGENLANRLLGAFSDERDWPQLVHIATDGETYGHHHAHGDMALAYALHHIESNDLAHLTNYGEYLECFPPTHEVQIIENTAWCASTASSAGGATAAATPAAARTGTRSGAAPCAPPSTGCGMPSRPSTRRRCATLVHDPWAARDDYVAHHPRPHGRERRALPGRPYGARTDRGGARAALGTARNAAPRDADVHELRLVLRRTLRHRDGAGDRVRRARHPTGGDDLRRVVRAALPRSPAGGEEQHPRASRRPGDLREVRQARRRRYRETGGALRDQFALRRVPGGCLDLLLHRRSRGVSAAGGGPGGARRRAGAVHVADYRRVRRGDLRRALARRSHDQRRRRSGDG